MRRLVLVILLLIVSVAASVVLLLYYREFVIGNMVSVIAIYLAVKILMLFSKSEKDLGIILEAVKNGDTTIHFNNVSYPGRIGEKLNEISATLHYTKLSIERNQTYFSYLLNQVPSGIFVANSVGKIFTVNKALLNIIRLPALGSVSRIYEIFPQAAETIATLGEGDIASVDIYDKNYAISCSKIKFPDRGELYIYVLTDIDLQLNRREIESWTMSVRTLSHEIMNNVTPIISISNTLSGAEYIKNCSHELKEGLAAISAIGEELMQFAMNYRALAHTPEPEIDKENLKDIVDEICTGFKFLPEMNNINITLSKEWFPVKCDRSLTYTAISNVLKNAVEAIGVNKKGEITIECFLEKNGYVRLDISNSGVAISDEIAKEIFSPFFTTKSQGQGIGLPLSKRIMVSQGGNLYMSHENHQRTTFSFTFLQA